MKRTVTLITRLLLSQLADADVLCSGIPHNSGNADDFPCPFSNASADDVGLAPGAGLRIRGR